MAFLAENLGLLGEFKIDTARADSNPGTECVAGSAVCISMHGSGFAGFKVLI